MRKDKKSTSLPDTMPDNNTLVLKYHKARRFRDAYEIKMFMKKSAYIVADQLSLSSIKELYANVIFSSLKAVTQL